MKRTLNLNGGALVAEPKTLDTFTCRVCARQAQTNEDAVLLCPACLSDLDATQARITARREAALAAYDEAYKPWGAVYDAADTATRAWWEQVMDMRVTDPARADALMEKAVAADGRGARLVHGWRLWVARNSRCADLLQAAIQAQEQINTARLNMVGVL